MKPLHDFLESHNARLIETFTANESASEIQKWVIGNNVLMVHVNRYHTPLPNLQGWDIFVSVSDDVSISATLEAAEQFIRKSHEPQNL